MGHDQEISEDELRVVGVDSYLYRVYEPTDSAAVNGPTAFSAYVGFYESQTRGQTIHSPKNCLPGAGWEALTSTTATVSTPDGTVEVNQYLIQRDAQRALVLYWYQGRGRVAANEYRVKFDLLTDSALLGRSDEALVRSVVPAASSVDDAKEQGVNYASQLIQALYTALP